MNHQTPIIEQLASSLNRRDEAPNVELAQRIASSHDDNAVNELVQLLSGNRAVQNDCIKVLYEIGAQDPTLIANHVNAFIGHLSSKNNRLQWGAMYALDTITHERHKAIFAALPTILAAAEKGSVITKDHAVNILIKLCGMDPYADDAFVLLMEQLLRCNTNQLPMYAERALPVVHDKNKATFVKTLRARLEEVDMESKRTRIEKVLRKLA